MNRSIIDISRRVGLIVLYYLHVFIYSIYYIHDVFVICFSKERLFVFLHVYSWKFPETITILQLIVYQCKLALLIVDFCNTNKNYRF